MWILRELPTFVNLNDATRKPTCICRDFGSQSRYPTITSPCIVLRRMGPDRTIRQFTGHLQIGFLPIDLRAHAQDPFDPNAEPAARKGEADVCAQGVADDEELRRVGYQTCQLSFCAYDAVIRLPR